MPASSYCTCGPSGLTPVTAGSEERRLLAVRQRDGACDIAVVVDAPSLNASGVRNLDG
jgi:hypothetical protein